MEESMTPRQIETYGISPQDVRNLEDKWIALYFGERSSDTPIALKDADGKIAGEENLIDLQLQIPSLLPALPERKHPVDEAYIKKHVHVGHIPKEQS